MSVSLIGVIRGRRGVPTRVLGVAFEALDACVAPPAILRQLIQSRTQTKAMKATITLIANNELLFRVRFVAYVAEFAVGAAPFERGWEEVLFHDGR